MAEDRWGKKSLPPPPPGMQGGAGGPVSQLHRSKERFTVGTASLCATVVKDRALYPA